MTKTGKEAYIELLKSFNRFFAQQSRILLKEIKAIKYATNYYREYESYYEQHKINIQSQSLQELEIIYDGIRFLEQKVEILLEQFNEVDKNYGDFRRLIEDAHYRFNNSHIAILPMIDSKIEQFQNLFDELNFYKQGYFNLVDSKEFPYIPSPKFNKRFRNANLGLFLNKQLNECKQGSYRMLISEFYQKSGFAIDDNIKRFNDTSFFAKWSYSTKHYIKEFNSSKNIDRAQKNVYISMSYAYFDKTIFHPIAFHEISHAMKHEKISPLDKEYLEESIVTFPRKDIFTKNDPFDGLYKEILCDLSAVYATGYSYVISLVHIGFFELKNLFLKYEEIHDSSENIENIVDETRRLFKIESNENIVPKRFDFNINNINLAVRLLILTRLCKKLKINNTYVNGIEYMLRIIFPPIFCDNQDDEEKITFLTMYKFISDTASDYERSRNLVYSLYEKLQSIILTDKLIKIFEERKESDVFLSFGNKLRAVTNSSNQTIIDEYRKSKSRTIFDLLWLCRENPVEYTGKEGIIRERDINRLFNIYSLFYDNMDRTGLEETFKKVFDDFFNPAKPQFYNFEFIKYKSTKDFHPFVEFMKNCKYNHGREAKGMSYIFAPYNIALLKEANSGDSIEKEFKNYPFIYHQSKKFHKASALNFKFIQNLNINKNLSYYQNIFSVINGKPEKNKYFVDRHSLFLLAEQENKKTGAFGAVIQIKLSNIFSQDDSLLLEALLGYIEENKKYFSRCRIFKSMGAEDYLVYVQGLHLCDTKMFGKNLISDLKPSVAMEIEDLILLENNDVAKDELGRCLDDVEIISFSKINTKSSKAKSYFSLQGEPDFLPDEKLIKLAKTPTNRFDSIMNWNIDRNIFDNIKKYLESTYYSTEDDESIYTDFNIEIMHRVFDNLQKKH